MQLGPTAQYRDTVGTRPLTVEGNCGGRWEGARPWPPCPLLAPLTALPALARFACFRVSASFPCPYRCQRSRSAIACPCSPCSPCSLCGPCPPWPLAVLTGPCWPMREYADGQPWFALASVPTYEPTNGNARHQCDARREAISNSAPARELIGHRSSAPQDLATLLATTVGTVHHSTVRTSRYSAVQCSASLLALEHTMAC